MKNKREPEHKGRTVKDSFKICSHRPTNCPTGCNQRKQVIADFIN